jgi:hypothetical protein
MVSKELVVVPLEREDLASLRDGVGPVGICVRLGSARTVRSSRVKEPMRAP